MSAVLHNRSGRAWRLALGIGCVAVLAVSLTATGATASPARGHGAAARGRGAAAPLSVTWMPGYDDPSTPAQYNMVGVIKVGPASAKNVLVLEPGTSAASSYFVPLAKWIVAKDKGWQVWSVERRENLLKDESELNAFKAGQASATQLFDYYLGYLTNSSITTHYQPVATSSVEFAKDWGMAVAVGDLRQVIEAASALGGKVVLGGHSLGGSVVTAYATWDFNGSPGADGLAGLVYIDGGSSPTAESASDASAALSALDVSTATPWLSFGGIPAPYAGLFIATGSAAALGDPDAQSLGQKSGLLPSDLVPSVPVTNRGQLGYAVNVATSPAALAAAQAHVGEGLNTHGAVRGWDSKGALTPLTRYAEMFEGKGVTDADGSEWYFPQRLTDDTAAVGDGLANPAQSVLGVDATMGDDLPSDLLIYAFCTSLGGESVLQDAQDLAQQSNIPDANLTLVNESSTYAHNDPAGAFPHNIFFQNLQTFLGKVTSEG